MPDNELTVSQSDTATETITEVKTIEAFKYHLTRFKGDAANLRNNNGRRRTVCERLRDHLAGCLLHAEVLTSRDLLILRDDLDKFYGEVHCPILNDYPNDNIYDTPLGIYKDNFTALYALTRP